MRSVLLTFFITLFSLVVFSQSKIEPGNRNKFEGYFNFYTQEATGKVFLEVENLEKDFLYVNYLSQGVGSNDIGLDRGMIGSTQLVYFKKTGSKLLLIQPNLNYRANTSNNAEKQSVKEAFAKSVLFGFSIIEKTKKGYLIDFTPFLMQDVLDVAGTLKKKGQGNYVVDTTRSVVSIEDLMAFPKNVEFEALLTFKGSPLGEEITSVVPNANYITVHEHHSLVELPEEGYNLRKYDPRCGVNSIMYMDYATPVEEPIQKQFITRHRLEKKKPDAAISEAKEPIVYYLDNGTPEPVKTALLTGGQWWNEAFEKIGYKDAFQIKILPIDANPLDIRYNVIQWVHRSTRGWSYGGSVVDPRTGEIIKGHVSLGSLRIRQDFLIAQALSNAPFAANDTNHQIMLDMALARIRQLSAHEIGHTLGFKHNFAASTNNRASVMDYPHPMVELVNGEIQFKKAYDAGIGDWDKVIVNYAYGSFPKNEEEQLSRLLDNAFKRGLRYVSDRDARPIGSAHAYGHLWDNGADVTQELKRVIDIRNLAIKQFSIDNIRKGEPLSVLEDLFVPLYFFHRYQTEAAIKLIGGMDYHYEVKGGYQLPTGYLAPKIQREAFDAVLHTFNAEFLAIPKEKLKLFPPRGAAVRTRESFKSSLGLVFDPLGAASTAASNTIKMLFHSERVSRLVEQKSLDKNQLGLSEVIDKIVQSSFQSTHADPYFDEIQQIVNYVILKELMDLSQNKEAYPQVKFLVDGKLTVIKEFIEKKKSKTDYDKGYLRMLNQFFINPKLIPSYKIPEIPDGSPIGCDL